MSEKKVSNIKIFKRRDEKKSEDDYFLGTVSFLLFDSFLVHGARLFDKEGNRYVLMPSRKLKDKWLDICHPTTQELRKEIEKEIFEIYDKITD
jgi:DNA-binding cell septation regulator SpoVG